MDFTYFPQALNTVATALIAMILIPRLRVFAHKWGFVSKIDFRRRESVPRPLLGGLAIFLSVLVTEAAIGSLPVSIVLPSALLVLIGVLDDKLEIRARYKMLANIACVALWLYLTPKESLLLVKMGLPDFLAYSLHAFWVVGLINAFNMIDGMDGLSGGMAVIGLTFLGFFLPPEFQIYAWSLAGGTIGFLAYNRPPATIFLGDAGSLFMGFSLAALGSQIEPSFISGASVLIPLFILAHPEIDAILAMARRYRAGTPLFQGDKDHIHHKLRRIGMGPYDSLAITYFASLYCGLTAVLINQVTSPWTIALVSFLCISGVSSILAGIYLTEYRLAAQFSRLGTPLLHQHVNIIRTPVEPTGDYHALVFDLLPYYKEIQERGIRELHNFVSEFATYINNTFKDAKMVANGPYSIIIISQTPISRDRVQNSFKALVINHDILKNDTGTPWGLSFYTDPASIDAFESKFAAVLTKTAKAEKAAA